MCWLWLAWERNQLNHSKNPLKPLLERIEYFSAHQFFPTLDIVLSCDLLLIFSLVQLVAA